jgi:hypothetical protein
VPDAAGVGIDVQRSGAPDSSLSGGTELAGRLVQALTAGRPMAPPTGRPMAPPTGPRTGRAPGEPVTPPGRAATTLSRAVERCRRDRSPLTARLTGPERSALAAVGLGDVGWLAVAPVPEVDAVATAWLRRAARPGDVAALESAAPLVADAVRSAEDLRDHLVVPPARLVIEQAKGVLMAHHGVGPDDAFDLLRSVSQRRNVPVRDLARVVVDGRSPVRPGPPQVPAP